MNAQSETEELARRAWEASQQYRLLSTAAKNRALKAAAARLRAHKAEIFELNAEETAAAAAAGLNPAMTDRMRFTEGRFEEMAGGVEKVAQLPDPVGRILYGRVLESGLKLCKKSVPLGVVGVVYESRPNVTVDIAALCLKSGNACVLRGGSECLKTNTLLHRIFCEGIAECGLNPDGVALVPTRDRAAVAALLKLDRYIDVLIPRGGAGLQRLCREQSVIPVITGGFGISHIFADESCDQERSVKVIVNAKVQKPSACNALDTLLVHEAIAKDFIPAVLEGLKPYKVKVHAHGAARALCGDYPWLEEGQPGDFDREFLALELNLALVASVEEACLHMRVHRASHSDSILTDSRRSAELFTASAGSACVYVNASTRFTDGGQFGLGAEVAISTQKLHARGPMALEELTTCQYVCEGDYLPRA